MKKLADINIGQVRMLDREAASILASAVKAAKKIIARRDALDQMGKSDQSLYVMSGEIHDRPAHKLHHLLMIETLRQHDESLIIALERPANKPNDSYIKDYLRKVVKLPPQSITAQFNRYASAQHLRGGPDMFYTYHEQFMEANYSAQQLHSNLFKMHIESQNYGRGELIALRNDTPMVAQNYIDGADPKVARIMQDCLGYAPRALDTISREGMYIRNAFMAEKLMDTAQNYRSRIAVQICGRNHVNGNGRDKPNYEGLCAIYKNAAQPVIGVFLGQGSFLQHGGLAHDEVITCDLLPSIRAYYNPAINKYSFANPSGALGLNSEQDEARYYDAKLKAMGLSYLKIDLL